MYMPTRHNIIIIMRKRPILLFLSGFIYVLFVAIVVVVFVNVNGER